MSQWVQTSVIWSDLRVREGGVGALTFDPVAKVCVLSCLDTALKSFDTFCFFTPIFSWSSCLGVEGRGSGHGKKRSSGSKALQERTCSVPSPRVFKIKLALTPIPAHLHFTSSLFFSLLWLFLLLSLNSPTSLDCTPNYNFLLQSLYKNNRNPFFTIVKAVSRHKTLLCNHFFIDSFWCVSRLVAPNERQQCQKPLIIICYIFLYICRCHCHTRSQVSSQSRKICLDVQQNAEFLLNADLFIYLLAQFVTHFAKCSIDFLFRARKTEVGQPVMAMRHFVRLTHVNRVAIKGRQEWFALRNKDNEERRVTDLHGACCCTDKLTAFGLQNMNSYFSVLAASSHPPPHPGNLTANLNSLNTFAAFFRGVERRNWR